MEFSIRGIGIIKEADIKMDGLTVIAGSNNSGKTTVGKALYAVTSAVEDLVEKQQQDQAKAVFYRIRKIVEPFDGWLSRSRYLSRKEVVSGLCIPDSSQTSGYKNSAHPYPGSGLRAQQCVYVQHHDSGGRGPRKGISFPSGRIRLSGACGKPHQTRTETLCP